MRSQDVLGQLKKLGKPNTVKTYARHGVTGPCYGVAYGDLKPLAKKIGRNQPLAQELWASGVHDARLLATMIAEPEAMTPVEIEAWLRDCNSYPITDAVSSVAAAMPDAMRLARSWIEGTGEWTTTAGWNVFGMRGAKGGLAGTDVGGLLETIERTIHTQPNRTRYAMNNVLIGIGGLNEPLRPRALDVARAIGTVHVDHGETGCKTPDAADYIAKLVAYRARTSARRAAAAKPSRTAGAKAKSPAARASVKSPGRKAAGRPR